MSVMSNSTLRWLAIIAVHVPAPAIANRPPFWRRRCSPDKQLLRQFRKSFKCLKQNSRTDWSKVNIEALRQHLIDMNNVTLATKIKSEPIEGGMRFLVTGGGDRFDTCMLSAHAATMDGIGEWHFSVREADGGAIFTVRVPPQDAKKLRGLDFIGAMSRGMHHRTPLDDRWRRASSRLIPSWPDTITPA